MFVRGLGGSSVVDMIEYRRSRRTFAPATLEYGSMSYLSEPSRRLNESTTASLCRCRELGCGLAERAGNTAKTRFNLHYVPGWPGRVQNRAPVCGRRLSPQKNGL